MALVDGGGQSQSADSSAAQCKNRLKVLVLSYFPALSPPVTGGAQRLLGLYRALSRHADVQLLSPHGRHEPALNVEHTPSFRERRVPKDAAFEEIWGACKRHCPTADPSGIALARACRRETALLHAFVELYRYADVIVHESPYTLMLDVFAGLDAKPRFYSSHNAEAILAAEIFPGPGAAPLRLFAAALEAKLLSLSSRVAYCSTSDLASFCDRQEGIIDRAVFVPNGADWSAFPDRPNPSKCAAVFVGSNHPPNVAAARFIIDVLAPALPEVTFEIVGGSAPAGRPAANVVCLGEVGADDKHAAFARAALAINPVASGSGSSLKVLEFANHGLPIVSTRFGMRGFDAEPGRDYVEAELDTMAAAIREAFGEPDALASLARACHSRLSAQFSWTAIADRMHEALSASVAEARRASSGHVLVLADRELGHTVGGGTVRMTSLYKSIAAERKVVCLTFSSDRAIGRRSIQPGMNGLAIPKTLGHLLAERSGAARHHVSTDDILAARHVLGNPLMVGAYRALANGAAQIVTEHPYMSPLPVSHGDRFVYSAHNHEQALKQAMLADHPDAGPLLDLVKVCERAAVEHADLVICCTIADGHALTAGAYAGPRVAVVPNGVPDPGARVVSPSNVEARPVAVFIGSAHMPNVDAADFIVADLAPRLTNWDFVLVGGVCGAIERSTPPNVRLAGVVEEAERSAILWAARIGLNPMATGGGSNVKMADYLAHSLPVISTETGARGYEDAVASGVVKCVALADFASVVDSVAVSPWLNQAADAARGEFIARHDMEALSRQFASAVLQQERSPPRHRVLAVTYRFTDPPLGGAEIHFRELLTALAESGEFDVDIAALDAVAIRDVAPFETHFETGVQMPAAMVGSNVSWRRFRLDATGLRALSEERARLVASLSTFRSALAGQAILGLRSGTRGQMEVMCDLYQALRADSDLSLTSVRGPHSSVLTRFLEERLSEYDLAITHNSVFATATGLVKAAASAGVASIIIPQVHLDDDYYLWPDVMSSISRATLALVSPNLAVLALQRLGMSGVRFLPPGVNDREVLTDADVARFRAVHPSLKPFFLVLGRKTGSKRYDLAIEAVRLLRSDSDAELVIIGPDEDGVPINPRDASYLGLQERAVVRGALQTCAALVTMSESESFGMVVLEAWLAGKPVLARADTVAFAELIEDGINGRLVGDAAALALAMRDVLADPGHAGVMGARGRTRCADFAWSTIGKQFIRLCLDVTPSRKR